MVFTTYNGKDIILMQHYSIAIINNEQEKHNAIYEKHNAIYKVHAHAKIMSLHSERARSFSDASSAVGQRKVWQMTYPLK